MDGVKTIGLPSIFLMHVHIGLIKTTVLLGKVMIKASFHLLDVIIYFSARKRCRERNECTSFVAVLELMYICICIYMYKGSGTYPCALLSIQFLTVENTKKNTSA